MRSSGSNPIRVSTEISVSRRCECRIRDSLSIQPKAWFLGVVLSCWQSSRDHLRLEAVSKASEIFIRIVIAGWLAGHSIGVMEDLLEIFDGGSAVNGGRWHFEQL